MTIPLWDEYYKKFVTIAATMSSYERLNVVCLFIKENRIIAQGYNGYIACC
jgi:dCMP deaminase